LNYINPAKVVRFRKHAEKQASRIILQNKVLIVSLCAFCCLVFGFMSGIHPLFAVGFLAIPFIVIMVYNPIYAYYLFVASMPLYVVPVKELSASVPRVVGIVMFAVWAPYIFLTRKFKIFKWDMFMVLVVIFYCWMVLTAIWSVSPEGAYIVTRATGMLIISVMIAITLVDKKDKFLQVVMIVLFTCTAAGIRSFNISLVSEGRAVGVEGFDQNEFASMLLAPLMICVALINYHDNKFKMLLYGLMGLGCFLGALSAVSRGFAIAVTAAFLQLYALEPRKKKMIILALLLFLCTAPYFIDRYAERMGSERFELESTAEVPRGRFGIWLIGWEIFKNHPFTGIGIGGFPVAFTNELVKDPTRIAFYKYGRAAHNDYLMILAELGIFGLILWISIVVQVYKKGFKSLKVFKQEKEIYLATIARGCISGFTGLLVAGIFLGLYHSKYMWMLLTIFVLMSNVADKMLVESSNNNKKKFPELSK